MFRALFLGLLGLCLLTLSGNAQELYDPYSTQRLPFYKLGLIKQYANTLELTQKHLSDVGQRLRQLGLEEGVSPAADSLAKFTEPIICLIRGKGSEWLSIYDKATLGDSINELYNRWIGRYSGMANSGYTFHFKDTPKKDAIRFALVMDRHILLYQIDLTHSAPSHDAPTPKLHIAGYEENIRRADSVLTILAEELIPTRFFAMGLMPDVRLTSSQRTYGLMKFWSEAKYNFAFFDQLSGFDWEEKLVEYLPLVGQDQSNKEYYRLLERLAATLQDGHTNVYPPSIISSQYGRPNASLRPLGKDVVVTNVDADLVDSLPLGSIVLRVDDIPVEKYLKDSIYPYVAAGGAHTRRLLGSEKLLEGPKNSQVNVGLRLPNGNSVNRTMSRQSLGSGGNWVRPSRPRHPASFRMVEPDIGYLALNSFSDRSVVDTFEMNRPQISRCKGLVIDLRENGGGNSEYGYTILRHFTRQPLRTPIWSSPEHVPAYRAFGQWYSGQATVDTTVRMVRESIIAYAGKRYYHSAADSIMPADTVYDIPVVVLVSTQTASSAENFLVVADPLDNFTFVGEPSFGSTGQPLFLDLPGGGMARICTKRNTYSDGRDYVGGGVQVDIEVQSTAADFIAGRDVVLERGLKELHK